jgi:predicted ribosome quality control (RQC) complex YloA/Tae2 family protein
MADLRRGAARPIRSALKKANRAIASVERDIARIDASEALKEEADLLQQAWGRAGRGASEIVVTDWETGDERIIALDPTKDLNENIHARYHRHSRLKRGRAVATARLETLRGQADAATEALAELELADESALRSIVSQLPGRAEPSPRRARQAERRPYHEFVASDGTPILVGRGSKDNDALTFRVARGNDVWLHASDWAGSHVVIRSGRSEPSRRTLEEAAMLAAHYSKGRQDGVVTVNYTQRKHVKKPKGAAPGRVSIAAVKSIDIRPEPDALARLFSTRR